MCGGGGGNGHDHHHYRHHGHELHLHHVHRVVVCCRCRWQPLYFGNIVVNHTKFSPKHDDLFGFVCDVDSNAIKPSIKCLDRGDGGYDWTKSSAAARILFFIPQKVQYRYLLWRQKIIQQALERTMGSEIGDGWEETNGSHNVTQM